MNSKTTTDKPIVLITGASGNIGSALCAALHSNYTVVGLDRQKTQAAHASYEFDLTSFTSVQSALEQIAADVGGKFAAVIHLAAYFDFTGEDSPLYKKVNVEGTRLLLQALSSYSVERFIYASTMLVHKPTEPGQRIDETTSLEPGWAYPKSKLETEHVIAHHATMPYTLLRLAGLYDEHTAVPTLSHQIARIYQQDLKSYLYSGDTHAGQAFLHKDDMIEAFIQTVERRNTLPPNEAILIGEEQSESYQALQNRLGELIHGQDKWQTISVPPIIAKAGAWAEEKTEPIIPDDFDHGEKPFIRPFMIDMASDHYHLDCTKAHKLLNWQAQHKIYHTLADLVTNLKQDPLQWYEDNSITPPDWISAADQQAKNPDKLRNLHQKIYRHAHQQSLWAHFMNMGFGAWLLSSAPIMGYAGTANGYSDAVAGLVLMILAGFSLSWRHRWARWGSATVGMWLLFAPLLFWTPSAAAYLNNTLVGMLVLGFAIVVKPTPGISTVAAMTGPSTPEGWEFNPSSWFQRMPIIALAFVGFFVSRYLTAYQLGHIDAVWDPFFDGSIHDPQNGTEEIITSSVSEAWPVPDAGIGALTYALEILTGLMGSTRRWRTMPWLVVLFGIMIVPLGFVSVTFIIIQPIIIGTWCTLCLIAACAMLLQIPYSLDELVATGQFLKRRYKAGRPLLKIFFVGDTDTGDTREEADSFERPPWEIIKDASGGGVNLPWNLVLCIVLGAWLMATRLTLGNSAELANWEHFVGAVVITIAVTALAEVARPARWLIIPFGLILIILPFMSSAGLMAAINDVACGVALILLAFPRGKVLHQYGNWNRLLKY